MQGLASVKKIIDDHNGSIEVRSEPGAGTTFTIAHRTADREVAAMTRILLVEDDEHQRLLYREELEGEGYDVVEACTGRDALARVEHDRPDAVVLDINMPGMDGLQTLARIHELNRLVPIVLNSAYAAYKDRFVSWIADAYVTKSSNLAELKSVVRGVLTRKATAS